MRHVESTGIRPITTFHAALDAVARERKYLAFVEAPPLEQTINFVRGVLADEGVQMVALFDQQVVGWCDIVRVPSEGLRHVGRLGMGLLLAHRGQGYGGQLAVATIDAARKAGIERVELEVFATNAAAIRLYERLGFQREGLKRRCRKLAGVYDDSIIMALLIAST